MSSHAQISVTQTQALSFGNMVIDPAGDTISLRSNGGIRSSNASDLQGGDSVAIFRFEGPRNTSISYSFSTGNTLTNNGQVLNLDNFVASRPNPFNIPGSGVREMNVGGDLIVPPSIRGGAFSGNFVLIVDNP